MYSEDMAAACVHLMKLPTEQYDALLGSDESKSGRFEPPLINIGVGDELSIKALPQAVQAVVGFKGNLVFDTSKPDGTSRKLMDVSKLYSFGFRASASLHAGLEKANADFVQSMQVH